MTQGKYVFISYSSKDEKIVKEITKEFERIGVSYWKSPEMIPAGSSYAKEIPVAIQNCTIFLLVLSPASQASIWVEKEIDSAICNRRTIIPFQIEEMELNDTFRFYLNNVQMISCIDNENITFEKLNQEINHFIPIPKSEPAEVKINKAEQESPKIELEEDEVAKRSDPRMRILSIASTRGDTNALRVNRIPLACQYCGCKEFENISMGTYRCVRCGKDNYDDFQTIRNYLDKAGPSSAITIEKETGVPRRVTEYFFKNEYLEIPKSSPVRIPCASCGAPIRTGTLCEYCKNKMNRPVSDDRSERWRS